MSLHLPGAGPSITRETQPGPATVVGSPLESSTVRALASHAITVEEEIQAGGEGVVYLARIADEQRAVALKLLYREIDGERHRFASSLHARLQHPGIVALERAGHVDGRAFLIMPLLFGQGLDQKLRTRAWRDHHGRNAFRMLLEAVAYCHSQGVSHGDLKPTNVRIAPDGHVALLDFGVALQIGRVCSGGWFAGTIAYAAPELLEGRPRVVAATGDVFTLGVILHELLTGRLPFRADRHRLLDPSAISIAPEIASDRLIEVIRRALAADASARHAAADELLADFNRVVPDYPLLSVA